MISSPTVPWLSLGFALILGFGIKLAIQGNVLIKSKHFSCLLNKEDGEERIYEYSMQMYQEG